MEKCRRLEEYAIFIATVREYAADKKRSLSEAITLAIDACIEKGILLDILTTERTEVFMYILESFDKELYERDLKQNAYDDGVQAGIEVGENNKLISLISIKLEKGKSIEQIAEELEESVETIEKLISDMEK
jgi:predicted transposase YdaD